MPLNNVQKLFAIIVLGAIAFIIAGALLPDSLTTYYNGLQEAEFIEGNESLGRTNMTVIVSTLFRLAPLGLALALVIIIFSIIGLSPLAE